MSLEEFAEIHGLHSSWIDIRSQCDQIVGQPGFWYEKELQSAARELAVNASDMLVAATTKTDSSDKPLL